MGEAQHRRRETVKQFWLHAAENPAMKNSSPADGTSIAAQ
jgi:hypothetical protein